MKDNLNEIGNTPAGQWMLGRLAGRQRNREIGRGDDRSPFSHTQGKIKNTTINAEDYAEKDGFGGSSDSAEAFWRGKDAENYDWWDDYDSEGFYDHSQHIDNERQDAMNMGYGYAMQSMINAQNRKNPQTVKLSESQLRGLIAESIKKVIKEYGYDSYPQSGYECFSEIGERAAYDVMRELKQYKEDIDEEALERVLDGFKHSFMALCEVGDEEAGINSMGIKLKESVNKSVKTVLRENAATNYIRILVGSAKEALSCADDICGNGYGYSELAEYLNRIRHFLEKIVKVCDEQEPYIKTPILGKNM